MNTTKRLVLTGLLGIGLGWNPSSVLAEKMPAAPIALTEAGRGLEVRYAAELAVLRSEIVQALPAISDSKEVAFRNAIAKSIAAAQGVQNPKERIQTAQELVGHAKNKWIAGAKKGIAAAETALKNANTPADREAAQKDLAKWKANLQDGEQALKERQAALDKLKAEEQTLFKEYETAQAKLADAQSKEMAAAKALLADANPVLANGSMDAKLMKAVVLTQATPKGLAQWAQSKPENEALLRQLLADTALMKAMLEAGGPKGGKWGQAMEIYTAIHKASSRAKEGMFHRLALGTSLEHAVPVQQRNCVTEPSAPKTVDPVQRYLHYEKAYLDRELDPAFPTLTAWEYRMVVNSYAPDQMLAWGREMLRNYRPDHILNEDYGWRYSGIVRTDVTYRHSYDYTDTDSLHFFQNIIKNGGICGRRAFFGRYICKSFGLPTWGVAQHAHAALGRWTPSGWVVNFGAGWDKSWGPPEETEPGRRGSDFLLETQARKQPQDYWKVLRAQWLADVLGEQRYDSTKPGSGGLWNNLALYGKKVIVADAKPSELAALGTELGEANESAATKAMAVAKASVTEADKRIVTDPNGQITILAAACAGAQLMNSFLGGQQLTLGGDKAFTCAVDVPKAGAYALTARVVTVHGEMTVQLKVNGAQDTIALNLPYTIGAWQKTDPLQVALTAGKNTLTFAKPTTPFTLKDITLTPVE